ncbi:helix-turn-helix domain-containing protein [Streptomyces cirratus]|uniref:helix-turn-helix domain-containing protein n=1 Tax=Streptomyces cirratus TaxID=68187 RepID=UPI003610BA8C
MTVGGSDDGGVGDPPEPHRRGRTARPGTPRERGTCPLLRRTRRPGPQIRRHPKGRTAGTRQEPGPGGQRALRTPQPPRGRAGLPRGRRPRPRPARGPRRDPAPDHPPRPAHDEHGPRLHRPAGRGHRRRRRQHRRRRGQRPHRRLPGDRRRRARRGPRRTARPFWTADHLGDDPPTPAGALDEVLHAESLHAVLGVPLRADDRHLGHLYVAARGIRHFTPEEVALMCSLADLAAVAIGTARHLEDVHTANTELEESGARVRASLSDALRANSVQDELVQLVLDGAGLDELLARAAAELGGGLAVQGQGGERLAEHGRIPRPDPQELARVRLDAAATGIACPLSDGTWVLPLSVRSEDVGCLLFHPEDATAAPGEQILLSYARTVSLLLVTQRSTAVEGQVRDELLADLTSPEAPPDRVVERAGRFAELHRPHVVVVAHARTGAAELVESWATAYARRHRGMKTVQGDRLVLLLPGEDAAARAREVRAELAGATGAQVTAGSCGPNRGADGVHPAYREAVRCLEALIALGGAGRSAAASELGFLGMLLAEENDVTGFVERTLGPLLDHDAERFGNLVETLQGWFMAAGSPTRAAELLYVHPNTVSRRLERITQLLGRDWQHPDRALELQLALRLRRARTSLDPEPAGPPSP